MRAAKLTMAVLVLAGVTGLASDFLTEGVDTARTGWVRDERVFTPANVGTTTLQWTLKLDTQGARDAQAVRAARRRARRHGGRPARTGGRGRRLR